MSVSHADRVFALEIRCVLKLCEQLKTPRALTVAILIRNKEWQQLIDLKVDPLHYRELDVNRFRDDALITGILSKNPRVPLDVDRKAVAIGKFHASEDACRATNERIGLLYSGIPKGVPCEYLTVINESRNLILEAIGSRPTRKDLDFAELSMRFGKGSTTSLSGVVSQGKKFSRRALDTTSRLLPFRAFCFPLLWKEHADSINIMESSRLGVVPKNAKTDRVICVEPDLNIFVQLGIGALLRRKLLHLGIDLRSQEINQRMAQRAYSDNLATIDLSAASDSVSRQLVWLLLPEAWCELLLLARTDSTSLNGETISLEKWSSMGNGYTFELETLIFWAIAKSVMKVLGIDRASIAIYGDDIIVPTEAMDLLVRVLNFLGFSTNEEKTFGKGLFYESCGTDYFCGVNVRPIYFRSDHHDFTTVCYTMANALQEWAGRNTDYSLLDSRVLPAWLCCFTAVPPHERYRIPRGYGDVGFYSDFDRSRPHSKRPSGYRWSWEGWEFPYRICPPRVRTVSSAGVYLSTLRVVAEFSVTIENGNWKFQRLDSPPSYGRESLRDQFKAACTKMGHVSQWPHLGPWL